MPFGSKTQCSTRFRFARFSTRTATAKAISADSHRSSITFVILGVDCIWVLPMYPSPNLDDGYDIADFLRIHPDYGTVSDFILFIDAAHARGLKVVADLVLNHTSDQHAWFQEARLDPNLSETRLLRLE